MSRKFGKKTFINLWGSLLIANLIEYVYECENLMIWTCGVMSSVSIVTHSKVDVNRSFAGPILYCHGAMCVCTVSFCRHKNSTLLLPATNLSCAITLRTLGMSCSWFCFFPIASVTNNSCFYCHVFITTLCSFHERQVHCILQEAKNAVSKGTCSTVRASICCIEGIQTLVARTLTQ